MNSASGFSAVQFGASGDIPQPADFDGDTKADVAFYAENFGSATDKPIPFVID